MNIQISNVQILNVRITPKSKFPSDWISDVVEHVNVYNVTRSDLGFYTMVIGQLSEYRTSGNGTQPSAPITELVAQ